LFHRCPDKRIRRLRNRIGALSRFEGLGFSGGSNQNYVHVYTSSFVRIASALTYSVTNVESTMLRS
jgi:hypothetical protein